MEILNMKSQPLCKLIPVTQHAEIVWKYHGWSFSFTQKKTIQGQRTQKMPFLRVMIFVWNHKQLGPNLCFDFILLNARMDFWPKLLQFAGVCITLPDQWIYCLTGLFSGPCHWKWRHWSLAKRAIHHLTARILGQIMYRRLWRKISSYKRPQRIT